MANVATSRLNKEYLELQRNAAKRQAAAAAAKPGAATTSGTAAAAGKPAAAPASASTAVNGKLPPGRTATTQLVVSDFDGDDSDIILFPTDTSKLLLWTAFITGPPDSPFENARFQLRLQVPATYPHSPPKVHFVTRVFHPNVHWPKADSPLNCDAGNLVRCGDARGYYSLARSCAIEHAHFQPAHCPPALSVVALTAPGGLRRTPSNGATDTAAAPAAAASASASASASAPFATPDAAAGNNSGGAAVSAPGSTHANTFVYLSQPLLLSVAGAVGGAAAAGAGAAAAAQHKTSA